MSRTALVIVDAQEDYFSAPTLYPSRDLIVQGIAQLLERFRAAGVPIAHIRTLVAGDGHDAMPHRASAPKCVVGTAGASPPGQLVETAAEPVFVKRYFRGFEDPEVEAWLIRHQVTHIVIAGLYTHACVRETALDAYERGYTVTIAEQAIGSDQPDFARHTLEWISTRAAQVSNTAQILAHLDAGEGPAGASGNQPGANDSSVHVDALTAGISATLTASAGAQLLWQRTTTQERAGLLLTWANLLTDQRHELVELIADEVHKPLSQAQGEVERAIAHIHSAITLTAWVQNATENLDDQVSVRHHPLGVVAAVMPWNNPLALPVGKIAPALLTGNAVVLKPSEFAPRTAHKICETLVAAGIPADLMTVVEGGEETVTALIRSHQVDGVTVTGSMRTGSDISRLCQIVGIPVQAELGGNNAAIVLSDSDLGQVVPQLLENAFTFAGQRCTAVRRFIVHEEILDAFIAEIRVALPAFAPGNPGDPAAISGPLISQRSAERLTELLDALERDHIQHNGEGDIKVIARGQITQSDGLWMMEPSIVVSRNSQAIIVQQESFGPIAVIQPATSLEHAIALANDVPQGLVTYLCTNDSAAAEQVARHARTGLIRLGGSSVPVHPNAPFGGWKKSGMGPAEHGRWDLDFYLRPQARYGDWPQ